MTFPFIPTVPSWCKVQHVLDPIKYADFLQIRDIYNNADDDDDEGRSRVRSHILHAYDGHPEYLIHMDESLTVRPREWCHSPSSRICNGEDDTRNACSFYMTSHDATTSASSPIAVKRSFRNYYNTTDDDMIVYSSFKCMYCNTYLRVAYIIYRGWYKSDNARAKAGLF